MHNLIKIVLSMIIVFLIMIVIITINYKELNYEIVRMWKMKKVDIIYHSYMKIGENQKQIRPDI